MNELDKRIIEIAETIIELKQKGQWAVIDINHVLWMESVGKVVDLQTGEVSDLPPDEDTPCQPTNTKPS